MEEKSRYATKKKGKTEVQPLWNMEDIKAVIEWFEKKEDWDGYFITMLELLLGRRIGDTKQGRKVNWLLRIFSRLVYV